MAKDGSTNTTRLRTYRCDARTHRSRSGTSNGVLVSRDRSYVTFRACGGTLSRRPAKRTGENGFTKFLDRIRREASYIVWIGAYRL